MVGNPAERRIRVTPHDLLDYMLVDRGTRLTDSLKHYGPDQTELVVPIPDDDSIALSMQVLAEFITSLGLHWSVPLLGEIVEGGELIRYCVNFDRESEVLVEGSPEEFADLRGRLSSFAMAQSREFSE